MHTDPTARVPTFVAAFPLAVTTIAASTYLADAVLASSLHASTASHHATCIAFLLVVLQRLQLRRGRRL